MYTKISTLRRGCFLPRVLRGRLRSRYHHRYYSLSYCPRYPATFLLHQPSPEKLYAERWLIPTDRTGSPGTVRRNSRAAPDACMMIVRASSERNTTSRIPTPPGAFEDHQVGIIHKSRRALRVPVSTMYPGKDCGSCWRLYIHRPDQHK